MQSQAPTELQLSLDSIRFFGWLIGAICVTAASLVGIYLRLYIHDALLVHAQAIHDVVAQNYVRRDIYDRDRRETLRLIDNEAES